MTHAVFDIAGRSALVTGSSRGIGRALATGLLEAGCTVVLNARNPGQLEATAAGLRAEFGAPVHALPFDNTNPAAATEAIGQIEEMVGPLDILVNNTGAQHRTPF